MTCIISLLSMSSIFFAKKWILSTYQSNLNIWHWKWLSRCIVHNLELIFRIGLSRNNFVLFLCFWILLHTLLGNCEKNEGKFDCEFVILSVCCQWNRQYRWFTPGKTEKEITWPLFLAVTLFDNLICWCFVFPFVVLIKVLFLMKLA